ncbi:alpha/beta hydrolase family protein [Rhizobium nepotum]|uniref:Fungal lipase-like domain-containing protein n=1 Tax=Rhizobium nepotum 39/7 TaxID=1368418 RepID=A0ABR5CKW1_9HYPH|nr:hypothetical protein [Rhizobium nepotum]KJF65242.1 hypothetical protein RS75_24325 [Rhizobium nepotum 39/7]
MSISQELILAILSMDSYNRDYAAGMLISGEKVGTAEVVDRSAIGVTADDYQRWQDSGFYAVAYNLNGQTVISYRGTDNTEIFDSASDLWNGWTLGGGYGEASQATLALDFYKQVMGHSAFDDTGAQPILTGHSLGGGLAGFVSFISGATGVGFDHMPFGEGAMAAIATELARRTGLFDPV